MIQTRLGVFFWVFFGGCLGLIHPTKHDIFAISDQTFVSRVGHWRQHGVAVVLLHDGGKEAKKLIDSTYNEIAGEFKGMMLIGAVDCLENPKTAENLKYKNKNEVIVLPPLPIPQYSIEINDDLRASVASAAHHISRRYISKLHKDNFTNFLAGDKAIPKVILISKKLEAAPIFHALANVLQDRLVFGFASEENDIDEMNLIKRFNVKTLPKLFVIKADGSVDYFRGNLKSYMEMFEFLNIRSETFVKGGGFSDIENIENTKPWLMTKFPQITKDSYNDICGKKKHRCAIFLTEGDVSEEVKSLASEVMESFVGEFKKIRFMWMDMIQEEAFKKLFNPESLPSFVVFNPHQRLRYVKIEEPASKDTIQELLDKILNGDARFTNVKGQILPQFGSLNREEL